MTLIATVMAAEERDAAAVTTNNEFTALGIAIRPDLVLNELCNIPWFQKLQSRTLTDFESVKDQLVNGWNTERILRITAASLTENALPSGLQWGFQWHTTQSIQ